MLLTELRIAGARTIAELRLRLDGLTVLIGDNGTGKSTILECCEILRRSAGEHFIDELHAIHGGRALLRQGAEELRLGVTGLVTDAEAAEELRGYSQQSLKGCKITYDLTLGFRDSFAFIKQEELQVHPRRTTRGLPLLRRSPDGEVVHHEYDLRWKNQESYALPSHHATGQTTLAAQGRIPASEHTSDVTARLMLRCLQGIRVHPPFEVIASWVARASDRKTALRTPTLLTPAPQLDRLGANLASAYHALRNNRGPQRWQEVLSYVQLGLGDHIEDVVTWADPGGGNIGLGLKLRGLDQAVPAAQISDGMLSYLAFVALVSLHAGSPGLLALDEPDLHLHPRLLMRVLDLLEEAARETPVLLATHSDRLLDGLTDPARSVALCELDERSGTQILRLDPQALARWLERYRGLGDIRAAGHEASVLTRKEGP